MNELASTQALVRTSILALQDRVHEATRDGLGHFVEPECPLTHHFAPGAYGREIFIPMGALVVGKIHKHAHLNILSKGTVAVFTEDGPEEFSAPHTWVSTPGTKRVVYARTDAVWTTVHVTAETDLEKIEDYVIAPTYEAFAAYRLAQDCVKEIAL